MVEGGQKVVGDRKIFVHLLLLCVISWRPGGGMMYVVHEGGRCVKECHVVIRLTSCRLWI